MQNILAVGFCGMLGVLTRFAVGSWFQSGLGLELPWATLFINTVGSFLIGIVFGFGVENSLLSKVTTLALMTGFLGGFTTFSAFSLEMFRLLETEQLLRALAYGTISPVLGVLGTWGGIYLVRHLNF